MATWQEVSSTLIHQDSFKTEKVSDSLIKALIDTGEGRNHLVFIGHQGDDVALTAVVCKLGDVNIDALFKSEALINFSYGLGSTGEFLVVKHVAPLADMNLTELLKPLVNLAYHGDILEKAITGGDAY
jgi:hypothetical protein